MCFFSCFSIRFVLFFCSSGGQGGPFNELENDLRIWPELALQMNSGSRPLLLQFLVVSSPRATLELKQAKTRDSGGRVWSVRRFGPSLGGDGGGGGASLAKRFLSALFLAVPWPIRDGLNFLCSDKI